MATKTVPVLGPTTVPDASGGVYFELASSNFGANDLYPHLVLVYENSNAREGLRGAFRVPDDYVGSPQIIIVWATTATTGSAVFDFDYTAVADNESLDPSADQESASVTSAAPGTARLREDAAIALTAANLAADDLMLFELFRESSDASDDLAASAYVFAVLFEYSDA